MAQAIRQGVTAAGNETPLGPVAPLSINTGNGGYPVATLPGSLLLLVAGAGAFTEGSGTCAIETPAPLGGVPWVLAGTSFYANGDAGAGLHAGVIAIYYIANAPAMTTGDQTNFTGTCSEGGQLGAGFDLYEITGAPLSPIVVTQSVNNGTPDGSPQTADLVVYGPAVVFVITNDEQSLSDTGPGYSSGVAPIGVIGSAEYMLNAPSGVISTNTGVTGAPYWSCTAVAFGSPTGFTPLYPPIKKQPFTLWGLEAKRLDSIASDGLKQSQLDHIDTVTTLRFPFVALSDMAAWQAFEAYALTGALFSYRPVLDYPNSVNPDPMFQYPGSGNGDNADGYSVVELLTMDWKPHFESPGIFSLEMKLLLIADVGVTGGDILLEDGGGIEVESGTGVIQQEN